MCSNVFQFFPGQCMYRKSTFIIMTYLGIFVWFLGHLNSSIYSYLELPRFSTKYLNLSWAYLSAKERKLAGKNFTVKPDREKL